MYRGFTVVEVLVVIVVLAVLASIITGSYIQYENRAQDSEAQSLAATVRSSAERYFNRNNEYPSAAQLSTTAQVKSILEIASSTLESSNVSFVPCPSAGCVLTSLDITKVYYLTKHDSDGTSARSYTIQSKPTGGTNCSYTFVSGEGIRSAYVLAYWSHQEGVWQVVRSSNGTVSTSSGTTCPFKAL